MHLRKPCVSLETFLATFRGSPPLRDLAVYEALYQPDQSLTDPGFREFRIANEQPERRELQFFQAMFDQRLYLTHDLTGLFSPRFASKTGLTSNEVRAFVDANSDGEVFTFNAGPQAPYFAYNIWMQGESAHPGLTRKGQDLLTACGIKMDLGSVGRQGPDVWCFSNFWVGSRAFWEEYVGEVIWPVLTFVSQNPGHPSVRAALEVTSHVTPAPFLPFIVERLFSTFLSTHPLWRAKTRAYKIEPLEARHSNDFDREVVASFRDRIDRADRDGEFSEELISFMNLLSRLRMRYFFAYHAVHPHPNTDQPLDASIITEAIEKLDMLPTIVVK